MNRAPFERLDFWGSEVLARKAIRPRGTQHGPRHLRVFVPSAPTLPSRPQASGGTNPSVSTGRHGRPDTAPPVYKPASVLTVLDDLKGEPRP